MRCAGPDTCRASRANDLADGKIRWALWRLPAALLLVGLAWPPGRLWLWTPSFVVMGAACVANAARCGRAHCYLTGPLFLLAAGATVLVELGVVAIAPGWLLAAVATATTFAHGFELLPGKYIGRQTAAGRSLS